MSREARIIRLWDKLKCMKTYRIEKVKAVFRYELSIISKAIPREKLSSTVSHFEFWFFTSINSAPFNFPQLK